MKYSGFPCEVQPLRGMQIRAVNIGTYKWIHLGHANVFLVSSLPNLTRGL